MIGKKIILAIPFVLTGCATSSINYIPPHEVTIINQIHIDDDFDRVWNRLVKNLASDFFVINNIEKSSRIINVSFSTTKPIEYVSCGESVRQFSNARGKKTYQYDPAESATYSFTNDNGHMFNAIRNSKLNGRTNIYVAPDGNGTTLSVNTKYIIDVNIKYYNGSSQYAGDDSFTFDFSTKTKYDDLLNGGVVCSATGSLEQRIISYAK